MKGRYQMNSTNTNKGIIEVAGKTIVRIRETAQERELRKANEWNESKANLQANLLAKYQAGKKLSTLDFRGSKETFVAYRDAVKKLAEFCYEYSYDLVNGLAKKASKKEENEFFQLWKNVIEFTNTNEIAVKASASDFILLTGKSSEVYRIEKGANKDFNATGVEKFRGIVELIIVKRVNDIVGLTLAEQKQAKEERKQAKKAKKEEERKNKKEEESKKQTEPQEKVANC